MKFIFFKSFIMLSSLFGLAQHYGQEKSQNRFNELANIVEFHFDQDANSCNESSEYLMAENLDEVREYVLFQLENSIIDNNAFQIAIQSPNVSLHPCPIYGISDFLDGRGNLFWRLHIGSVGHAKFVSNYTDFDQTLEINEIALTGHQIICFPCLSDSLPLVNPE